MKSAGKISCKNYRAFKTSMAVFKKRKLKFNESKRKIYGKKRKMLGGKGRKRWQPKLWKENANKKMQRKHIEERAVKSTMALKVLLTASRKHALLKGIVSRKHHEVREQRCHLFRSHRNRTVEHRL